MRGALKCYFYFLHIAMISRETLTRFGKDVEHMREVHGRAVLLNMAVYVNIGRLMVEDPWVFGDNRQKSFDLCTRSAEVLNEAVSYLYRLQLAYEEWALDDWESAIRISTHLLETCKRKMGNIERELDEVYPEHVRTDLEDQLARYYHYRARPSEARPSEARPSEESFVDEPFEESSSDELA